MRLIDADRLMKSLKPEESVWVGLVLAELVTSEPTVEAIPIKWLKEYLVKLHKEGDEERDYVINELGGYEPIYKYIYETGIREMLEDWEKENGIDR